VQILGTLSGVEVRKIWPSEAADFTPWLATEENIGLLSAAIGLELEVEHTEVAAGPYSADIVARDSATGNYVVIENQLQKTDHDHLGKALTYAAVLGAKTVVWIASTFTDEHKKVMDWLNESVADDISFFAVQLELWSINGSAPAVKFNVLSRPVQSAVKPSAVDPKVLSESRKLQLEWWTAFRDELVAKKALPSFQSPRPQYWYNIALGRTGIHLSATANTFEKKIGMRVYLMSKYGGKVAMHQLLEAREAIEKDIGCALQWDPNPEATDKVIVVLRDADLTKKEKWPEHLRWLVDMTIRFRKVFGPRIKELDLSGDPAEDDQTAVGEQTA